MYKVSTLPVASLSTYAMGPMHDNEAELEDHDNDGSYSTLRTGIHLDDLNTSSLASRTIDALKKHSQKTAETTKLVDEYYEILKQHKGTDAKEERKQKLEEWAKNAASHVPPKPPAPPKLIDEIRTLVTRQTIREVKDMLNNFIAEFENNTDKHKKQKWSRKVRKYCETHNIHLHHQPVQNRRTAGERYEIVAHNNKIEFHKIHDNNRVAKARTMR